MEAFIHITAWERKSPGRRVACALVRAAIASTVLILLIDLLGPPIGFSFLARSEARKFLGVKIVPMPLANYSVSDAPGTVLSCLGYEFEVPWNASFKQKAFGKGGTAQLQFDSGQSVTFIVPANQGGLLTEIVQDQSSDMKHLQLVFGDLMNRPAYGQSVCGTVEHGTP
jgi:hypothetical protein